MPNRGQSRGDDEEPESSSASPSNEDEEDKSTAFLKIFQQNAKLEAQAALVSREKEYAKALDQRELADQRIGIAAQEKLDRDASRPEQEKRGRWHGKEEEMRRELKTEPTPSANPSLALAHALVKSDKNLQAPLTTKVDDLYMQVSSELGEPSRPPKTSRRKAAAAAAAQAAKGKDTP